MPSTPKLCEFTSITRKRRVESPIPRARIVAAGHTRRIDVGRVEDRHFLNVLGFGFDIAVIEHSPGSTRQAEPNGLAVAAG